MENIAVIFGGKSAEHDVSIITALASIIKPLELLKKYRVVPIYITKEGDWYSDPKLKDINYYSSGEIRDLLNKLRPISLEFNNGLKIVKNPKLAGRKQIINIDLVFPSMHGTFGEDGSLMGLLEMANVPYVGCGLNASVLAMDKVISKEVAESLDIPVVKYLAVTKSQIESNPSQVLKEVARQNLKYPLFVKPAHLGSSIGITRVVDPKDLLNALEVALHYDDLGLVEEEVQNLFEVTLPIIGNHKLIPALLEHPLKHDGDFFDFDTKYLQGGKKGQKGPKGSQGYSQIPAKLEPSLYSKAEQLGLRVYSEFKLSGIARVDMLIDLKTKAVYFNEINPLPGGLYAHNFNQAKISNVELVDNLVLFAKERFQERKSLITSFNTNYLRQF